MAFRIRTLYRAARRISRAHLSWGSAGPIWGQARIPLSVPAACRGPYSCDLLRHPSGPSRREQPDRGHTSAGEGACGPLRMSTEVTEVLASQDRTGLQGRSVVHGARRASNRRRVHRGVAQPLNARRVPRRYPDRVMHREAGAPPGEPPSATSASSRPRSRSISIARHRNSSPATAAGGGARDVSAPARLRAPTLTRVCRCGCQLARSP